MNETIAVTSGKEKRNATINVETPEVLRKQNLQELVEVIGEDMAYKKIMAQLVIDFRSMVRGKMESQSDEEWNHDLETLQNESYIDWIPSTQIRKSKEEKASETLSSLSPDQLKAALAKAGIDLDSLK